MTYILPVLCLIIGVLTGFFFMFQVSKAMVDKVRTQEEQKHMELIKHMDKASEHWQDIVIDIRDEVRMGHLQGKSIKDQEMLIKTIIAKDRPKEQAEVIKVTAE